MVNNILLTNSVSAILRFRYQLFNHCHIFLDTLLARSRKLHFYRAFNPSLPLVGQKSEKMEQIVDESTCNLLILLSGGF
jgi:hypothetical protein